MTEFEVNRNGRHFLNKEIASALLKSVVGVLVKIFAKWHWMDSIFSCQIQVGPYII